MLIVERKETEEEQLEANKKALAQWEGSSCHLQYPPGNSDEDALERIHNTYPKPVIQIKPTMGPMLFRRLERCE